jgi:hypothetical protein
MDSLLLSRRALSSPTTCRFIPAHLVATSARLRFADRSIIIPGPSEENDLSSNRKVWVNCLSHPWGPRHMVGGRKTLVIYLVWYWYG